MQHFFSFVALSVLLAANAQAQVKLVPAQSEITFIAKQSGVPLDGRFAKFDAQFDLDAKKPEAGKVSFTIDLGSAVVGDLETTKELKKPEWFNFAKFPNATFTSSSIKSLGAGKLEVAGALTIKGIAKPITVAVTLKPGAAGAATAEGGFAMKRLDFKIGDGDWADVNIVANDVSVKFKLNLTGM